MSNKNELIVVRGGGDLASGVIYILHKAGYKVISLEIKEPSSIRRTVSFSEAIYDKETTIENVKCVLANDVNDALKITNNGNVAMLVDENCESLSILKPDILVDAILAKKNLGTHINMAKKVIALGPGFTAKKDCHYVIETMRGHKLGKVYEEGSAIPNTGIPGLIASHAEDRVIHSEIAGVIHNKKNISDIIHKGDVLATISNGNNTCDVTATIDGVLRGLIRDGFNIPRKGFKIADIDPRIDEIENCFTISDKARFLGSSVLLAINM